MGGGAWKDHSGHPEWVAIDVGVRSVVVFDDSTSTKYGIGKPMGAPLYVTFLS